MELYQVKTKTEKKTKGELWQILQKEREGTKTGHFIVFQKCWKFFNLQTQLPQASDQEAVKPWTL